KRQLEEAYLDLSDKHTELEDRRVYIETVLEAITTGVVSFDPLGRLTTINRAAARMLGVNEATAPGRLLEEVFAGPGLRPVVAQVQRMRRPNATSTELAVQLRRGGATLSLVASATETITHEVDGLKRLVDEFSRFARMPVLAPRPTDVRQLVDSVASLYRESHPALSITTHHPEDLPMLEVDPDHIKRAVLNLVDNAVEAVGGTGDVRVETMHLAETGHARIIVADNGPGISPDDKEKLFLPYFSTKVAGMGLGLPIVH